MTLARFSEAFLVLRGRDAGLPVGEVPLVMVVMNLFYAGSAYPLGAAADRIPPRTILLVGMGLLMAADVVLALAAAPLAVFVEAALWGLHLGFTQGLLSKLVSEAAPSRLLGTARPLASSIWSPGVPRCWRVPWPACCGVSSGPPPRFWPGPALPPWPHGDGSSGIRRPPRPRPPANEPPRAAGRAAAGLTFQLPPGRPVRHHRLPGSGIFQPTHFNPPPHPKHIP